MMVEGTYNPKLRLPLVPFSDGAGEVVEVGEVSLAGRSATVFVRSLCRAG